MKIKESMHSKKVSKKAIFKIQGNKVWIGRDGFLYVKISKTMTTEIIEALLKGYLDIAKTCFDKPKVLVDMGLVSHTPMSVSSIFRKKIVDYIKKAAQDPGFEKAAVYGGDALQRTVIKFILAAVRLKTIKHFKSKEEAIKWLKE